MPRRFQYPVHAKLDLPESLRPETPQLDKWHQPLSEPVRQVAFSMAAILASGMAPIDPVALTLPENITVDKWYVQLSEPVLVPPPLPTAAIPSFETDALSLTLPENITLDKWYQPLAEPVREIPFNHAALDASGENHANEILPSLFDPADNGLTWSVPLNEPVRETPFNPAALMPVVFDNEVIWPSQVTPAAPTVGQAVMVGGIQRTQYQAVAEPVLAVTAVPDYGWFEPLAEPVRPILLPTGAIPSFVTDAASLLLPENITIDKWFVALSEPVLVPAPLPLGALYPFVTDAASLLLSENITLDKWYQQLSEPVWQTPRSHAALVSSGDFNANEILPAPPAAVPEYDWYQPLSEPVRPIVLPTGAIPSFVTDAASLLLAENITVDKWFERLSEPVLVAPPLPLGALYPFVTDAASLLLSENITLDKWFAPLSEPVLPISSHAALERSGESHANEILPAPVVVPEYDWYVPLSEPVLVPPPLPTADQPWVAEAPYYSGPEIVFLGKWYQPFSEPIFLPSHHAGLAASGETHANEILPAPPSEVITLDKWHSRFGEPVLPIRPNITAGELGASPFIGAEVVFLDRWFEPLSEPIFLPRPLAPYATGAFDANETLPAPVPETITLDKWFLPLAEPIPPTPLPIAALPWVAQPPHFTGPEVITVDKWFRPLDEPVRPAETFAHLWPSIQDANEILPAILDYGWFVALTEPVQVPKPLPTGAVPWLAEPPPSAPGPEVTSLDKWFHALSEPVRPRPTFAHLMPTVIDDTEVFPPQVIEVVTLDKWYQPLDEPYPYGLPRSEAALIASGAYDANEIPPPTVSVGVYRRVTLADFDARVVERLGNSVFWDSSERLKLINEALRTWNSLTAQWKRRVEIKTVVSGGKPHIYYDLPGNMTMAMRVEHNNRPLSQGSIFDWDQGDPYWEGERGVPEEWAPVGINIIALRPVDPSPNHTIAIDGIAQTPSLSAQGDLIDIGEEEFNTILDYIQHIAAFKEGGQEFQSTMRLYQKFIRAAVVKNERLRASAVFRRIMSGYEDENRKQRRVKGEGVPPIGMR